MSTKKFNFVHILKKTSAVKYYIPIWLIIGLFLSHNIYAQSPLTQELNKANKLRLDFQFDKALRILKTQEEKAKKNAPEHLPEIYNSFVRHYITKDDFRKAKYFADKALEFSQKTENPNAKGYGFLAQSYYLKQINTYDTSLEYAKKAQEIIEKKPTISADLACRVYYVLYGINSQWEDFQITNHFANQSILWAKKAKNYDILTNAFSAKSTAMGFGYAKTQKPVYKDSITYYLRKANAVYEQYPEEVSDYTYGMSNVNMASIFYTQLMEKNTKAIQDSILFYLNKTNTLRLHSDFNYELRANILGIRSQVALKNGQINEAENLLQTALSQLKKEEKRPANYTIMNVLDALIDLYKQKGDYLKALELSEEKWVYSKKEYDINYAQKSKNIEAKYQNSILKNNLENAKQKEKWRLTLIYSLIITCLFILSVLYFTLKNHKKKIQLENQTKERILAEQKILVLEKDKIQKEALISALQIEQKNEVIKEIESQIKNEPEYFPIKNIIHKGERISNNIDQNTDFTNLHPKFFEKLAEKSVSKLSKKEEKTCAYIYLGMGNKELATLYNVETKTIRMTKYRIKQKLGLDKDTDLEDFLKMLI